MTPQTILAALVALYPSLGRAMRDPVVREATVARIELLVGACREAQVRRCAFVVGIAFVESGLRVRRDAPLAGCKPYSLDDARQARCAARSWNTSLRVCRTIPRTLTRYQYGACVVPRRFHRARVRAARYVALVRRVASTVER